MSNHELREGNHGKTATGGALLQLLELRLYGGDFLFQAYDVARFVRLLLGARQLLLQLQKSLAKNVGLLFGFFVHEAGAKTGQGMGVGIKERSSQLGVPRFPP